jgi:hypothetical protein
MYLVEAKSNEENWVLGGSIWQMIEENMSGSPSSNRKVVWGGPRGERGGCWSEGGVKLKGEGK